MNNFIEKTIVGVHQCDENECYRIEYKKEEGYFNQSSPIKFENINHKGHVIIQRGCGIHQDSDWTDKYYLTELRDKIEFQLPDVTESYLKELIDDKDIQRIVVLYRNNDTNCPKFGMPSEKTWVNLWAYLTEANYKNEIFNEILIHGYNSYSLKQKVLVEWKSQNVTTHELIEKVIESFNLSEDEIQDICLDPKIKYYTSTGKFEFTWST